MKFGSEKRQGSVHLIKASELDLIQREGNAVSLRSVGHNEMTEGYPSPARWKHVWETLKKCHYNLGRAANPLHSCRQAWQPLDSGLLPYIVN